MSGSETLIDQLCDASRFVHSGLSKFDTLTARLNREDIEKAAKEMAADGEPDAEGRLAIFADARDERTKVCRGELHRDLWIKAHRGFLTAAALFDHFDPDAETLPGSLVNDLIAADRMIWAGLKGADEVCATVNSSSAGVVPDRDKLLRKLWERALPHITLESAEG